jgi:hypothetical protein
VATPRAHFADVLIEKTASSNPVVLSGATVTVRDPQTTTKIADTLYASFDGVVTLTNPLTANANGEIEFWLPNERTVDLYIEATGYVPKTRQVLVEHFTGG